jgi:hypothetical protein
MLCVRSATCTLTRRVISAQTVLWTLESTACTRTVLPRTPAQIIDPPGIPASIERRFRFTRPRRLIDLDLSKLAEPHSSPGSSTLLAYSRYVWRIQGRKPILYKPGILL